MIKKFFSFVTLIVMLNFTIALAAQSVIDTQNLLTQEEINSLTKKIQSVEQRHQIKIGIEFLKNTHGNNLEDTANSLLDKNFSGAPNGGILLLVVMDTRHWKISTDSTMRSIISNRDTEAIAKHFVGNLSNGDYYDACNNYIDEVDNFLTYYENNGTAYDNSMEFDSSVLVCAIVVSIICGVAFRSMLIGSMSNVKSAQSATNYLERNSVKITEKKDTFLFTNITRRRKSKGRSTQSSGRGGGGGGSHGGSSGSF